MPVVMIRKKKAPTIDKLGLSNPQKVAIRRIMSGVRGKYKKLLHETHERMHIIADLTSSLEFWYNVNGSYEYVSPSCKDVLGYDPEEFTRGRLLIEKIVHEDHVERFRQDRAKAFTGESGVDAEYRMRTKTGGSRYVLMSWSPVITRKGKHIGIRISMKDITDYKRCQHFSTVFKNLSLAIADELPHTGVLSLSSDHTIVTWNATVDRMFGWSKDEAVGHSISEIFPGQIDALLAGIDALECDTRFDSDLRLQTRNGGEIEVRVIALPLCDIEGALHQSTILIYPLT
ncbi:MAG: PAS domain S-box protein [Bacteroidota bacterium]